jgi:vacuolar iron transporter family protein
MLGIGAVSPEALPLAGLVTLVGGSLSMAIGEYVSVASQYDMEKSDIERERAEHAKGPEVVARETEGLVRIYIKRGLSRPLAKEVVKELHAKDAVGAHVRDELGIDVDGLSNPWVAAFSSMAAFAVGSAWPVAAAAIVPTGIGRIIAVIVVVIVMLCIFGATGAYIGGASLWRAGIRVCIGGSIAMGLAYGAGWLAKNKLGLNVYNG